MRVFSIYMNIPISQYSDPHRRGSIGIGIELPTSVSEDQCIEIYEPFLSPPSVRR